VIYQKLGLTGLNVSKIGFGGAAISGSSGGYSFGPISDRQAIALLEKAFEKGVNIFDTAPMYGFGNSEKLFGKFVKEKRDKVVISTKGGLGWHKSGQFTGRINHDNSPVNLIKMLDESLVRLKQDYIDIYFIHQPCGKHSLLSLLEELSRQVEKGKIKTLGICNIAIDDLAVLQHVEFPIVIQNKFNLLYNDIEVFAQAKKIGHGTISWGTFHQGLFTDNFKHSFDKADVRRKKTWFSQKEKAYKQQLVTTKSITSEAFNFVNSEENINCSLIGFSKMEYLNIL